MFVNTSMWARQRAAFIVLCLLLSMSSVDAERENNAKNLQKARANSGMEHIFVTKTAIDMASFRVDTDELMNITEIGTLQAEANAYAQFLPYLLFGLSFGMRSFASLASSCVCFVVLFKLLRGSCLSNRCDCRRCDCIARALLYMGWDKFQTFQTVVRVHSVKDVVHKASGLLGGEKEFSVKVSFGRSIFQTGTTRDLHWDQAKTMDVPQGSHTCQIALISEGKYKQTRVGAYQLKTKENMLDQASFWGQRQQFKLESKGKVVATLSVTFWKLGESGSDGLDGSTKTPPPPVGIKEDSILAFELRKAMANDTTLQENEKLEGAEKIRNLAKILHGQLREVNSQGKELGKVYVRIINCNCAELKGEDMDNERERQKKKAKAKGIAVEEKWYWCWYENHKAAYSDVDWHFPDGYIPLAAVTSIYVTPDRNDQFIIKFFEDGERQLLIYRREPGKSLTLWVEGLEVCSAECRKQLKDSKLIEAKKMEERKEMLKRMSLANDQYIRHRGHMKSPEQWTEWNTSMKRQGFTEDWIQAFYRQMEQKHRSK